MNLLNKTLFISGFLIKKSPLLFNSLLKFKSNSLRIIYYHIVSEKKHSYYFDNKSITPVEFEHQMNLFKKYYDIISLSEALLLAKQGRSLKRKLVITFDDGFHENYTVIAPILIKLKLNATFYLIGNCIDNKDLMWRNKLLVISKKVENKILKKGIETITREYNLNTNNYKNLMNWSFHSFQMSKKDKIVDSLWNFTMNISIGEYLDEYKPYMTVKQIKELNNQGFEFGSHSMSHPIFSRLSYEEFENEINDSKTRIEQIIDKRVNSFSYPFGKRANTDYEKKILNKNLDTIDTFLGTRNRLHNFKNNNISWERDNLEFPFEIALSRFLIVSAIRSY